MADGVFDGFAKLREALVVTIRHENRVVAEACRALWGGADVAFYNASN